MKALKTIIGNLVFDNELVNNMKQTNFSQQTLYNQLISGKISLKEYLSLV